MLRRTRRETMKKDTPRTSWNGTEIKKTLSSVTVESYASAIMSLWKLQHATLGSGLSMKTFVRTSEIKSILRARKMNESQRKRNEFVDRGSGTLLDGYSE